MAMTKIFRSNFQYNKAGIMLSDFYDEKVCQLDMFKPKDRNSVDKRLMQTIDKINKTENGPVTFLAQGIKKEWSMKRELQSPKYTTNWNQLPRAN